MNDVVLIGHHIEHSRSPALHNALFERYGVPLRYGLCELTREEVLPTLRTMKRGGYRGANVTSPYKQTVLSEMDDLSDEAAAIGAVNTIVFEHGRAVGYNTDSAGFAWSLRDEPLLERPFSAAVLGTGGAAMAAVFHLVGLPNLTSLTLYSRDDGRARTTADRWGDPRLSGRSLGDYEPADLLVHATPVGLPSAPGCLVTTDQLAGVDLLYEMIYAPDPTELARCAREAGVRTISGSRMFLGQAARSFLLWTGIELRPDDLPSVEPGPGDSSL